MSTLAPPAPPCGGVAVPIIDLSAPPAEAAAALRKACSESGFLVLANHGVPQEVVDAQCEASKRFFALPLEQKTALLATRDPNNRGYSPANEQALDPTALPDTKEGYYVGRELSAGSCNLPLHGPNVWPPEPVCPGFRQAMMDYHTEMVGLSNRILRLLESALELQPGWFEDKFDRSIATLRPLHYPPQDSDVAKGEFGAGAHTDFGIFTLLLTDQCSGLQVQYQGQWHDVPPRPDCFVFNIGDLLQIWTNGLFKSTLHRVVNTGRERYSTAFFLDANFDAPVEALPTCTSPSNPPKFAPTTAGAHLLKCLKLTHTEHVLEQ